jgi:hypothetical protein
MLVDFVDVAFREYIVGTYAATADAVGIAIITLPAQKGLHDVTAIPSQSSNISWWATHSILVSQLTSCVSGPVLIVSDIL